MATKEHIKALKGPRENFFFNNCKICDQQVWNNYYGCRACKCCIFFVLQCISIRRCMICYNEQKCIVHSVYNTLCSFCFMKTCLQYGMNPTRFGIHDDSYYMKDIIPTIPRHVTYELMDACSLNELKNFKSFFDSEAIKAKEWIQLNPPDNPKKPVKEKEWETRCIFLMIVEDSLPGYDLIKIENIYYDPYKCTSAQLQYLTIMILELIRKFRDKYPYGNIDLATKKALIYFSGRMKENLGQYEELHKLLAILTFWLKTCRNLFEQLI